MAIYDFIPDSLLGQVANADQFLAVLVFDRWVANADGRQSILFRAQLNDWLTRPGIPPRKLGFVALMIDHGFAFNGPHWELNDSAITGLYPRRIVYRGVRSLADFEPWDFGTYPELPRRGIRQSSAPAPAAVDGGRFRAPRNAARFTAPPPGRRIPELLEACRHAPGNPFPWMV